MELDQRLAPTARADLAIGHHGVPRHGAPIRHPSGQLTFVECRSDSGDDARAPARVAIAVVPAVDGRARQADAAERDVMDGKAPMSCGHDPTVTARTAMALPRTGSAPARDGRPWQARAIPAILAP